MAYMNQENMNYEDVVDAMIAGKKKFKDISESQLMQNFMGDTSPPPRRKSTFPKAVNESRFEGPKFEGTGPEQGQFEEVREGGKKSRHDDVYKSNKEISEMMKELKGTLTFKVLKQRAPKVGDTAGGAGFDNEDEKIISHLIHPTLDIKYKDKSFDKIECDGDMKDDEGKYVPFCNQTFKYRVQQGTEDLTQYVTFNLTDRDREVGQLRLKMQTLINNGQ